MKTVAKKTKHTAARPTATPRKRLLAWKSVRGLWKKKKPDPVRELVKMRKEWAR